jgi:hypothetical protein
MGARQRAATTRRARAKKQDTEQPCEVKTRKGTNEKRRELYHSNKRVKASVQRSAREYYRRNNPKAAPNLQGRTPRVNGVAKEVLDDNGKMSVKVCYTVPSAAEAVGKSVVTFKKWMASGWIPAPVHIDMVYSHNQYTLAEVKAIVAALVRHYETYDYLNANHTSTIAAIKSGVEKAREE